MSQIGPLGDALSQMLQNVAMTNQSAATTTITPDAATTSPDGAAAAPEAVPSDAQPAPVGRHHSHGHGHAYGLMFKKIEAAVTSALQAAQSDAAADPNKVIEDAIAQVLKGAPIKVAAPGQAPNNSALQKVEVMICM